MDQFSLADILRLIMRDNPVDGDVDDYPSVFKQLYQGGNRGKMLVRLPAARE